MAQRNISGTVHPHNNMVLLVPSPSHLNRTALPSGSFCLDPHSIHTNCLFLDICYDWTAAEWSVPSYPSLSSAKQQHHLPHHPISDVSWNGVSLRSRVIIWDAPPHRVCNPVFHPRLVEDPTNRLVTAASEVSSFVNSSSNSEVLWVRGTVVHACIWCGVFGHVLLEMMLPAFMAGLAMAQRFNGIELGELSYMVEERHGQGTQTVFSALANQEHILTLEELVQQAKKSGKSAVCFERLIAGFRLQSALERPEYSSQLSSSEMTQLRNFVVSRIVGSSIRLPAPIPHRPVAPGVSFPSSCEAVLLQRRLSRVIVNLEELVLMLATRTGCTVKTVFFEDLSMTQQIAVVATAAVFVHVAGSGSHQFIWLPDGAASIVIVHPEHISFAGAGQYGVLAGQVNAILCAKRPDIFCLQARAEAVTQNGETASLSSDLKVVTASMSEALDFLRMQTGRGKFASETK
jgi:hypothetical protein